MKVPGPDLENGNGKIRVLNAHKEGVRINIGPPPSSPNPSWVTPFLRGFYRILKNGLKKKGGRIVEIFIAFLT